jgi:hypothetical protein
VSGTYNFGASYAVARFTAAGALDTSFNTVGYRLVSFPGYTVYYRYVGTDVDANDNVMLSGIIADSAGNHYIGLTRILPNGLPDGTF